MDARSANDQRDEAMLLDVREPAEWQAGHIDGAVHIPMYEIGARQQELPTDQLIVCVCRSGQRSGVVANALAEAGYRAENLDGGMHAWVEQGLPVVSDDGGDGRVI